MKALFAKLLYEMQVDRDTVLVTIIADNGSTPRGSGSQMLIGAAGLLYGTIGGGAVEKNSVDLAMQLRLEKKSAVREFNLRQGAEADIGMVCGGDVTVMFQFISGTDPAWHELVCLAMERMQAQLPTWFVQYHDGRMPSLLGEGGALLSGSAAERELPLSRGKSSCEADCFIQAFRFPHRAIIFGAGHIALTLCEILKKVDFNPVVFDNRSEFADASRFPDAVDVICGDFSDIAAKLQFQPDDFVVIMTSGHSFDFEAELHVLQNEVAYLGVIGSRSKRGSINQRLMAAGIPEERLGFVHTPIGTAIKAVTPEEIAVSIAGEMILVRAQLREASADGSGTYCPV